MYPVPSLAEEKDKPHLPQDEPFVNDNDSFLDANPAAYFANPCLSLYTNNDSNGDTMQCPYLRQDVLRVLNRGIA